MSDRPIPASIRRHLNGWNRCFWIWNVLHYLFGLTATIGTVLIAVHSGEPADPTSKLTGVAPILVAICTSCLTFLKASTKANAYIQAWRILDLERIAYSLDPNYPDEKLVDAVRRGETIIGKTD